MALRTKGSASRLKKYERLLRRSIRAAERLEDRRLLAVDLADFEFFLPDAIGELRQQGVQEQVFAVDLPLIGDLLNSGTTTPAEFLSPVQDAITDALASLNPNPSEAVFTNALATELGSLLVGSVTRTAGNPAGTAVEYTFNVAVSEANALTETITLADDLALPGLRIDLDSSVNATLKVWYDMTVTFGVENYGLANESFYIGTSAADELDLNVEVTIAPGTDLSGELGLLQFDADALTGSGLVIQYAADLVDANGKLTETEINAGGVDFQTDLTDFDADLLLDVTASFGGSAFNPKIKSDFELNWDTTGTLPETSDIADLPGTPTADFGNVRLDLDEGFFKGLVAPYLQNVRQFTSPIEPIVGALNQKPLEKFGVNTSLLDLLGNFLNLSESSIDFFETVTRLQNLSKEADEGAAAMTTSVIQLGSFGVSDVREATSGFEGTPVERSDTFTQLAAGDSGFSTALTTLNSDLAAGQGLQLLFLQDPVQLFLPFIGDDDIDLMTFEMPQIDFAFFGTVPIASVPIPPFGPLLTGNLDVEGGLQIVGNLKTGYDGEGLRQFQTNPTNPNKLFDGFYVDTTKPLIHISGWDGTQPDDNIISFVASVSLNLSLSTIAEKAGLDLPDWFQQAIDAVVPIEVTGEVAVKYGLTGQLDVELRGNDVRFRLSQVPPGECIFEVTGEVGLGGDISIAAEVTARIPFAQEIANVIGKIIGTEIVIQEFSKRYDQVLVEFPVIPLFTFNPSCSAIANNNNGMLPPEVQDPKLATLLLDGTLRLNVGPFVGIADPEFRKIEPTRINEAYFVRHVSGNPNDAAGETLRVEAFGVSQQFAGVKRIFADAREGDDTIVLDSTVLAPSELLGGPGKNALQAGAGAATLVGGPDMDTIVGSPQADSINGGAGDDNIDGGDGNDMITAGLGNDMMGGGAGLDTLSEAGDVDFELRSNRLTGLGTDRLNGIEIANLTGGSSVNSFTVRPWPGEANLFGLGNNDRYRIEIVGAGDSQYTITDSAGTDSLMVVGTRFRDDFTVRNGVISEGMEEIAHSGIEEITVDAGAGMDRVNVQQAAAGTSTEILGGADSDLIRVSSNAGINDVGNLAAIQGALSIDAGAGGANRLDVSDFGGDGGQPTVLRHIGGGVMSLSGIAPVPITYTATGGRFSEILGGATIPGFDTLHGVIIRGSNTQSDVFQVLSTLDNATTRLEGYGGNEQFFIGDGDLNTVAGRITVTGDQGADAVFVDDDANALLVDYLVTPQSVISTASADAPPSQVARTFGGLVYDGTTERLELYGTDANNIFEVQPSLDTRIFIDGNLPAPGTVCAQMGDFLKLDTETLTDDSPSPAVRVQGRRLHIVDRGKGTWSFTSPHQSIDFESIEGFNHVAIVAVGAVSSATSVPLVRVYDAETGEFRFEFLAYEPTYRDGVHVATGDIDQDGLPDVIVAPGRSHAPEIKVFNGTPQIGLTGQPIPSLGLSAAQTFGGGFVGGVSVATGDVNGDGCADIIVAPLRGPSTVKVFQNNVIGGGSLQLVREFFAFDPSFIGGVSVAVGDLDGDHKAEIITGSGSGMRSTINVFDLDSFTSGMTQPTPVKQYFPFDESHRGGVNVAAGDFYGDGTADIVAAAGPGGQGTVEVLNGQLAGRPLLAQFQAFDDQGLNAPAFVQSSVIDGNELFGFFTSQNSDGRSRVIKRWDLTDPAPLVPDMLIDTLTNAVTVNPSAGVPGNPTVSLNGGTLTIVGSGADDFVSVTGVGAGTTGEYVVVTHQGTQTVTGVTRNIEIDLSGGNDRVVVNNAYVNGSLFIVTGFGSDHVNVGVDKIVSTRSDLSISLGEGDDMLAGKRLYIGGNQTIDAGLGSDHISFEGAVLPGEFILGTSSGGQTTIQAGDGNDDVRLSYSFIVGDWVVQGGLNDDSIDIRFSASNGNVSVLGDFGLDTLIVDANFLVANLLISGGAESDRLELRNSLGLQLAVIGAGGGADDVAVSNLTARALQLDLGSGVDRAEVRASLIDDFFASLADVNDQLTLFGNLLRRSNVR